jgi:hypothetical protein
MALHEPPCDDILTHVGRVYDEEVVGIPDLDDLSRVTLDDFRRRRRPPAPQRDGLEGAPTYYAVLQRLRNETVWTEGAEGGSSLERAPSCATTGSVGDNQPMNAAPD